MVNPPILYGTVMHPVKLAAAAAFALLTCACQQQYVRDPELRGRDLELMRLSAPMPVVADPEKMRYRIPNPTGERTPGTIVVDSAAKFLYLVEDGGTAMRYPIAVGSEANVWTGEATIGRKAEWPSWTPGAQARSMVPGLPATVPGGARNPLGARALYLYEGGRDTEYRIHGTNEPESIGHNVSLGCIRMYNIDVIDLADRAREGARVVVR